MKNRGNFVLLVIALIIFGIAAGLYFFRNNIPTFSFLNKKSEKIPITTSGGVGDEIPSIWLWISSTEVVNESGTYFMKGNLGENKNLKIKIFLGNENDNIGHATTTTWNPTDINFPERFPQWEIHTVGKIESDSARSNYAIVKVHTGSITPPEECDDSCNFFLGKYIELQESNLRIAQIGEDEKLDDFEVGPAVQILQIIEK